MIFLICFGVLKSTRLPKRASELSCHGLVRFADEVSPQQKVSYRWQLLGNRNLLPLIVSITCIFFSFLGSEAACSYEQGGLIIQSLISGDRLTAFAHS